MVDPYDSQLAPRKKQAIHHISLSTYGKLVHESTSPTKYTVGFRLDLIAEVDVAQLMELSERKYNIIFQYSFSIATMEVITTSHTNITIS